MAKPAKYQIEKVKGRYVMTDEQRELFTKKFPTTLNRKLATMFGVGISTILRMGKDLGLHKNQKVIAKKRGAEIVKACTKNGYYASIKGKRPSQACIDATRAKFATGYHPFQCMSKSNYEKMIENMRVDRRALIASERRRQARGLDQKTKLRLPQFSYTISQINHRYNALNRGYLLGSTSEFGGTRYTIYYDSETKRSPAFERNCNKDGFTIKEYKAPKQHYRHINTIDYEKV